MAAFADPIKLVVNNSADITAQTDSGVTALHYAALGESFERVTAIPDNGAD